MEKKFSSSLIISKNIYQNEAAKQFRLIYSGRTGKAILASIADAQQIENQIIPEHNPKLIELLNQAEMLIDSNQSDVDFIISRNYDAIAKTSSLYFVILTSTFCNMGCTYCGQAHQKGGINKLMAEKIVKRIEAAVNTKPTDSLSICWFGGEPLVNFSKIVSMSDRLVALAQERNIKYHAKIVTNGSLLTKEKLLELATRCQIKEIAITFDGPKTIHDQRRILKNGKTSFDFVTGLLQEALTLPELSDVKYVFRTNIDHENREYIDEYIDTMYAMGFAHPNISYDLKGVYSWSNDVSKVQIANHAYANDESLWLLKLFEYGMNVNLLPGIKKSTCTATNMRAEVISSSGNVFSCTEHPLVPEHELTDYISTLDTQWDGSQRAKGQFDSFYDLVKEQKVPCSTCAFFGVCGGACPKQWAAGNIACPSFKLNIQNRMDIFAAQNGLSILDGDLFRQNND